MDWIVSHRADPLAVRLADEHYTRQKPGTPQFVPPGRCVVLRTADGSAVWTTSWPFPEYVRHAWPGAWVCSIFRNTGPLCSSDLIRQAVAVTRWVWPEAPRLGMVTFVDARKVRAGEPGYCFRCAGFRRLRIKTKGGLYVLQMRPDEMPDAEPPVDAQLRLIA